MPNQDNPYQVPQANLELETTGALASRWSRLAAALIDGLLMLAIELPVMYLNGYFDGAGGDDWEPALGQEITAAIFGVVAFLLVNGYLLKNYGQTIGKRLLGISIRDMQGNLCDFVPMVLKREILWQWVVYIPVSGGFIALADILTIFRKDRRCLHDLLAGTQVINVKTA